MGQRKTPNELNQPHYMKRHIITIITLSSILTSGIMAQDEKRKGPRGERGKARKEMLKKLDSNNDGKLSADEKAKAQAGAKKRRASLDTDGDGKISKGERLAALKKRVASDEKLAKRIKARFDADNNDKLSDQELTKAAAAMHKRQGRGKEGNGKKPRRGKKGKKSQE